MRAMQRRLLNIYNLYYVCRVACGANLQPFLSLSLHRYPTVRLWYAVAVFVIVCVLIILRCSQISSLFLNRTFFA